MKKQPLAEKPESARRVALAGNPNVGKSTVFNALTGLHQRTGNWTGKTVATAEGVVRRGKERYRLIDLPGTYSLAAHSAEEEIARNALCFGDYDAVIVVCDATRLCRNLPLLFQVTEVTPHVLLCVNLIDEAERVGIRLDRGALEAALGIPVVMTSAGRGRRGGTDAILSRLPEAARAMPSPPRYGEVFERALALIEPTLSAPCEKKFSPRFAAMQSLCGNEEFCQKLSAFLDGAFESESFLSARREAQTLLDEAGIDKAALDAEITSALFQKAEAVAQAVTASAESKKRDAGLSRADRLLTSRTFGIPAMLALLAFLFWLTVVGANAPSAWLSAGFDTLEPRLHALLLRLGAGTFVSDLLTFGLYRVVAWVVSVMLPPMAIFFPLFTLLEDIGYLPRVAFNLDGALSRCDACGKQALTMCMGLGCNAAGVTGARILDASRERRLAILTNSFMPCNGRFPAMIALATVFFGGVGTGGAALGALTCAAAILVGVGATLLASKLLSKTLLRGESTPFLLELPPFRRPQVGKILVRSLLDRTVFVLGRAITAAAPAGVLIWLLANASIGDITPVAAVSDFLDPLGRLLGLNGVILLAFLLGLPANEIVLPLCVMMIGAGGTLTEIGDLPSLASTLASAGWTIETAICFLLFSLMHWPCATTLATVRKETGSIGDTLIAAALPTAFGAIACGFVHALFCFFA